MKTILETQNYQIHSACTGLGALNGTLLYKPEVVILDLDIPGKDGIDTIKKIRESFTVPIIAVTSESDSMDNVKALDAGADDYLTKPFSVGEFLTRIRETEKRNTSESPYVNGNFGIYENGRLKIDFFTGSVYIENKKIYLGRIEYRLLRLMAKNTGKALTYNYILSEVWKSAGSSKSSLLKVFMSKLKKKIEKDFSNPQYIQTCIGVGYRMARI